MKIILNIAILLCVIQAQAQTPTVEISYNATGHRIFRTILNPSGFQASAPRKDTSLLSQTVSAQVPQADKGPVKQTGSSLTSISIYPNPVITDVTIKATDIRFENKEILIYDITGKIVIRQKMEGLNATIDMSALYSGVYLVRVSGVNSPGFISRIIKQ